MDRTIHKYLYDVDRTVRQMEHRGVFIDAAFCMEKAEEARQAEAQILSRLPSDVFGGPTNDVDVRVGESSKKLIELLHGQMGLPHAKFWSKGAVNAAKGEVKVDATAIGWLAGRHPEHRQFLNDIVALRRERACIKYLAKLPRFINPVTGRVHCSFGAASESDGRFGAVTGRLACKLPELQQIPRDKRKDKYRIRTAFRAQRDSDVILTLDYKALEVVKLAHYAIDLFNDYSLAEASKPGAPDLHSVNAYGVYSRLGHDMTGVLEWLALPENLVDGLKNHPDATLRRMRDDIKAIWYGLQYGKQEYGLGNTLFDSDGNLLGEKKAKVLLDAVLETQPAVKKYQSFVWSFIRKHKGIGSWLGRWRDLSHWIPGKEWQERAAWRKALNHPMQAGAAEVVGTAMAKVAFDPHIAALGFTLVLQVHDELMLEGPKANAEEAMARAKQLMVDIPIKAQLSVSGGYGDSWEGAK